MVLTHAPLDPAALLEEALEGAAGAGAVVSFTGVVRGEDGGVEALELDAYEGFAQKVIGDMATAAMAQFRLLDLLIVHRIGPIAVGEAVVFVAAAAPRRRAAFLGADHIMDYLKSRAPFWKKSIGPAGSHWVSPRPEDYEDAARWAFDENTPP